jgi:putative endonuclease
MNKPFSVYILYSQKIDLYYIGISSNLEWRLQQHNRGLSPFTRGKGPWEMVFSKEYPSRVAAQAREKEIKSWKSRELMKKYLELNRQSGPGPSQ